MNIPNNEKLKSIHAAIIQEKNRIDYNAFTEYAVKEFQPLTFNRTLYVYNSNMNLYEEDTGIVESWIQYILQEAIFEGILTNTYKIQGDKSEVYKRVKDSDVIGGTISPFNKFNGIPVGNGVLIFDKDGNVSLLNYNPEMRFTRKISTNYNSDVNTGPIMDILRTWVNPEDAIYLIQIAAQALVQSLPEWQHFRKSYLIVGEARGGKTTYLTLLEYVFGKSNISHVGLHQLRDRFNSSSLENKFINTADDIPNINLKSADDFKTLVAKREHEIEVKGKQRYQADITAVHVYTCNRPPELDEHVLRDDAFWDRWVLIRFPYVYQKIANWTINNFTQNNIEAFFYLVVAAAAEMIKSGQLIHEQDLSEVTEMWQHESSPLNDFLEEHTETGLNFKMSKNELFDALIEYTNTNVKPVDRCRMPTSISGLTQKLLRIGITPGRDRVPGESNKKRDVYNGLRWNPNSIYSKKETKDATII